MVVHVVLRPIFGRRTEIWIGFLIRDTEGGIGSAGGGNDTHMKVSWKKWKFQ